MIRAIISDFDGTLVDTFEANLLAYQRSFNEVGLALTSEKYRECFGFRFDRFMTACGISDDTIATMIKRKKREYYPEYFDRIKVNDPLMELISFCHNAGIQTALASTASRSNLDHALEYTGLRDLFDVVIAGEEVKNGKPSPEIYNISMSKLGTIPEETLIFEDSNAGLQAASLSGAKVLKIEIY